MTESRLSSACRRLWVAITWVWVAVLTAILIGVYLITSFVAEPLSGFLIAAAGVVAAGIIGHIYLVAYWKRFRYTFDQRELRVYCGVWWRKQVLIPFSRITHVNIAQGPWQRRDSLATLKIQTASRGADSNAEAQLFSQENVEELREEILKRINQAQRNGEGDGTSSGTSHFNDSAQGDQVVKLLKKIEENTR